MQEIDQRDRELLNALQSDLPLVSTPFAVLGQSIDMSEKEVLKRAEKLKREGLLRQISATFDTRALGYRSCLVAASVADDRTDHAAAIVNLHPGVTQNYRRNHEFNLWFTLAVPPNSRLGIDRTVAALEKESGARLTHTFPTLKHFKNSGASDWIEGQSDGALDSAAGDTARSPVGEVDIEFVRLLQKDLPLVPRPWDALGRGIGMSGDDLLDAARRLSAQQQIRRFSGSVPERKVGFSATVMGVWAVPAPKVDEVGARMATYPSVSHSYIRPTYPDWPYNLFTTVHGRSVDECESALNEMAIDLGLTQMKALFPIKEYKRSRIALFSAELEEWESARLGTLESAAS
ncbi:MAG TPA: AsnC family transcriptional regulator [Thermoanaerobaculia bacterium]|nr:AsnC family transcriptional regulator [Thermoanaerobaculia bacterium]